MFKKLLRRWGWMKPEPPKIPWLSKTLKNFKLWHVYIDSNSFSHNSFAHYYRKKWTLKDLT
jgi:hypothetical protein